MRSLALAYLAIVASVTWALQQAAQNYLDPSAVTCSRSSPIAPESASRRGLVPANRRIPLARMAKVSNV